MTNSVQFIVSSKSFCCSIEGTVNFLLISLLSKNSLNSLLEYPSPLSETKIFFFFCILYFAPCGTIINECENTSLHLVIPHDINLQRLNTLWKVFHNMEFGMAMWSFFHWRTLHTLLTYHIHKLFINIEIFKIIYWFTFEIDRFMDLCYYNILNYSLRSFRWRFIIYCYCHHQLQRPHFPQ